MFDINDVPREAREKVMRELERAKKLEEFCEKEGISHSEMLKHIFSKETFKYKMLKHPEELFCEKNNFKATDEYLEHLYTLGMETIKALVDSHKAYDIADAMLTCLFATAKTLDELENYYKENGDPMDSAMDLVTDVLKNMGITDASKIKVFDIGNSNDVVDVTEDFKKAFHQSNKSTDNEELTQEQFNNLSFNERMDYIFKKYKR